MVHKSTVYELVGVPVRTLRTRTVVVHGGRCAGDGAAAGLRGAAAVGAGRGAAAGRAPALGAGHPALAAHALQPAAAARHVPRPVPRLHPAHEHARLRHGDQAPNRQGEGTIRPLLLTYVGVCIEYCFNTSI